MRIRELFTEAKVFVDSNPAELTAKEKVKYVRTKGGKVPLHKWDGDKLVFEKQLIITPSYLDENGEIILPIKKTGQLVINSGRITSFKNCPETVRDAGYTMGGNNWVGSVVIASVNKNLTSLEGFPKNGLDGLRLGYAYNLNYQNVHKYIPAIRQNSIFEIANDYKGPILGIFKIKGLSRLSSMHRYGYDKAQAEIFSKVKNIVNAHLANGRNIVACQEELFKNGLDEYAKL